VNIKGASRAGGRELANHLLNAEKNETVKVFAVEGTVSQNLYGAFQEMEAVSSGTRCTKPLYHLKISPDPKEPTLSAQQWQRSIDALKDQFGLKDHAYTAVIHRKYGAAHPEILREHMHVVFCRINPDTMLAMHDGHNYRQHELVSRQLEKEFGHARIQGAHIGRDGEPRPQRTPPDWMMQQAAKSGVRPADVKAAVQQLWKEADSAKSFAASLAWEGYTLAVGRRDLVVLDHAGDVHTLARCLDTKVSEIRDRMASIDRSTLPTVDQAREEIKSRSAEKEVTPKLSSGDPANDNRQEPGTQPAAMMEPSPKRAALQELATSLQGRGELSQRQGQDETSELKERLAGFGFDASKPEALVRWQELDSKVEAGRITDKDRFRDMAQHLWEAADKERREEQKTDPIVKRPEPVRDRP
jgi:hypothetical protein